MSIMAAAVARLRNGEGFLARQSQCGATGNCLGPFLGVRCTGCAPDSSLQFFAHRSLKQVKNEAAQVKKRSYGFVQFAEFLGAHSIAILPVGIIEHKIIAFGIGSRSLFGLNRT
jgi:hypothetical protein